MVSTEVKLGQNGIDVIGTAGLIAVLVGNLWRGGFAFGSGAQGRRGVGRWARRTTGLPIIFVIVAINSFLLHTREKRHCISHAGWTQYQETYLVAEHTLHLVA
jgi:hypothetical protein